MSDKEIAEASIETLTLWAANAATTHCSCGGHGKAAENLRCYDRYNAEIEKRGGKPVHIFPRERVAAGHPVGSFNGKGAV